MQTSSSPPPTSRRPWAGVLSFPRLSSSLGLAVSYWALGVLGLALADGHGYASPFFPAAGLAVAAMLYMGLSAVPGLWLGAFAVNLSLAWHQGNLTPAALGLAMLVASGTVGQACAAKWLLRRFTGWGWRTLLHGRDVALTLGLAGPVASVISPSVAVVSMAALGLLHNGEWVPTWINWWMGDALGILIALPLAVGWAERRRANWRDRVRLLTVPALVGGLSIAAVVVLIHTWEFDRQQTELNAVGSKLSQHLQQRFAAHQEVLQTLALMVAVQPDLTPVQFDAFTQNTLRDNPDISALSINHMVNQTDRSRYERLMTDLHGSAFVIRQRGDDGTVGPATRGTRFVTVGLIAPMPANQAALGFDVFGEPKRRAAVQTALATQKPALTAPLTLVQDKQSHTGALMVVPIAGKDPTPLGRVVEQRFAVGVYKLEEMVRIATTDRLPEGLLLKVTDTTLDTSPVQVHLSGDWSDAAHNALAFSGQWPVAGRELTLTIRPSHAYMSQHRDWISLVATGLALLMAAMLQCLLLIVVGQHTLVRREVKLRTQALNRSVRDLSEAQAAALQLNQELSVIYQNASVCLAIFEGRTISWANEGMTELLGHTPQEVKGQSTQMLFHDEAQWHAVGQRTWTAQSRGLPFREEVALRHRDGSTRWALVHMRAVDPQARPIRSVAAIVDITERHELKANLQAALDRSVSHALELNTARQAAEVADRAKSQFLSNMSHEMRTPLNALLGYARMLEANPKDPSQQSYIQRMRTAGHQLLGLINDVLDLSKLEAGEWTPHPEPMRLGAVMNEVTGMLMGQAMQAGLTLREHPVPLGLSGVYLCDTRALRQMLINLVGNAIKFTPKGRVDIHVLSAPDRTDRMVWRISDTGIGIAPEDIGKLFNRFSQVDSSATRRFQGSGLGLSIVHKQAQAMGGDVRVSSEVGVGSVFELELPLQPASPEQARLMVSPKPPALVADRHALDGLHVLVVDDSPLNLDVAQTALQNHGAKVDTAMDGQDAIEWLMAHGSRVDVVLMDVHMPVMDGLAATSVLRSDDSPLGEHGALLPIVAMTAGASPSDRDRVMAVGMNDCIVKPFDEDQLVKTVQTHAQRYRAQRGLGRPMAATDRVTQPAPLAPAVTSLHTATPSEASNAPRPEASPQALALAPMAWSPIEGIDMMLAKRQLRDWGLMARTLHRLRTSLDELTPSAVQAQHHVNAWVGQIHRLAGTVGALGAAELLNHARTAEQTLKSQHWSAWPMAFLALQSALSRLCTAAAPAVAAYRSADLTQRNLLRSQLPAVDAALWDKLQKDVNSRRFAALKTYAELRPALHARLPNEACDALDEAMDKPDFEAASTWLAQVAQAMGNELPARNQPLTG